MDDAVMSLKRYNIFIFMDGYTGTLVRQIEAQDEEHAKRIAEADRAYGLNIEVEVV